ncbi:hypothetical protein GCM10011390_10380 [Aureimonas endophytica]|uniref:Uncharacterized protein n=2 Tax=Aureimonas endophytica TaxID=2027858 RepID=A0A917E1S9_9HYPH|nr:hypothetical protein GCM10011390_10380 [Aureimonas endophytica]
MKETRRAGQRKRASKIVLCRNIEEDTAPLLSRQAAVIAARFAMSDALARAVAELAFAQGKLR